MCNVVGFWLVFIFALALAQQHTLIQVQVVTRHGARTPLSKAARTLEEGGGERLTPTGERQQYDLGIWLRQRYSSITSRPEIRSYNSSSVLLRSSSFARTIVSAQNLALGLFPERDDGASMLPANVTRANVPIYTKADGNDVDIRAYANCPTFSISLDQLYRSSEFMSFEQTHIDLLQKLGQHPSLNPYTEMRPVVGKLVPLSLVWNAFDIINVAKTECDPNPNSVECLALPDPSIRDYLLPDEWAVLQQVAHYAEHQKYGRKTAGTKLGGNILLKILENMEQSPSYLYSWVLFSAHYPTILSIFATLDAYTANPPLQQETIPNYASALIFELYEDAVSKERSVRMVYKEGLQVVPLALSFGSVCPSPSPAGLCPLSQLAPQLRTTVSYGDVQVWCKACENKEADECLSGLLSSMEGKDSSSCDSSTRETVSFVFLFAAGTVLGCFTTLIVIYLKGVPWKKSNHSLGSDNQKGGNMQAGPNSNDDNPAVQDSVVEGKMGTEAELGELPDHLQA
mmetsp:Transcript_24799/g.39841  ORF Transcript_24799/g.39841 Transcript_24799/m.39841 type:complete len:513 (-) Transcript_24799:416-1954(-)